jgi:hypothetical protein
MLQSTKELKTNVSDGISFASGVTPEFANLSICDVLLQAAKQINRSIIRRNRNVISVFMIGIIRGLEFTEFGPITY